MEDYYIGPERRGKLRYSLKQPAEYSVRFCLSGSDDFKESFSGNIGLGGILLLSSESYSTGESLDIEICFHSDDKEEILALTAQIVWVDEKDLSEKDGEKKYFIGAQFEELTTEKNSILIDFLEKYIIVEESDEEGI